MLQQLARGLPLVRVEGERGVEEGAEVRGDGVDGLDLRLAAARDQIHRAHRRLAHVRRLALPRQGDVEFFITMLFNFDIHSLVSTYDTACLMSHLLHLHGHEAQ